MDEGEGAGARVVDKGARIPSRKVCERVDLFDGGADMSEIQCTYRIQTAFKLEDVKK